MNIFNNFKGLTEVSSYNDKMTELIRSQKQCWIYPPSNCSFTDHKKSWLCCWVENITDNNILCLMFCNLIKSKSCTLFSNSFTLIQPICLHKCHKTRGEGTNLTILLNCNVQIPSQTTELLCEAQIQAKGSLIHGIDE